MDLDGTGTSYFTSVHIHTYLAHCSSSTMPDDNPQHRPPKYDKSMKRKQIHLPDEMIEFARDKGNGTLAEGVRKCIKESMEREE